MMQLGLSHAGQRLDPVPVLLRDAVIQPGVYGFRGNRRSERALARQLLPATTAMLDDLFNSHGCNIFGISRKCKSEKIGTHGFCGGRINTRMTWWERLAQIIDTRGLTPERIASVSGVPLKSVYGYLKGDVANPRGDVMRRLAVAVGTTEAYLRYGTAGNSERSSAVRKIPLIKLNAFATLVVPADAMSAWDGVSDVIVPMDVHDGCYAVEITDDSGGSEFRAGDVLICDQSAAIEPGRVVVAVLPAAEMAVFGRYKPHSRTKPDAGFSIEHANPDYPATKTSPDQPGFVVARAIRHVRNI